MNPTTSFKALGRSHIASIPLKNKTRGLTTELLARPSTTGGDSPWHTKSRCSHGVQGGEVHGGRCPQKARTYPPAGNDPKVSKRSSQSVAGGRRAKQQPDPRSGWYHQRTRCGAPSHKPQGVDADALIGEAGGALGSNIWLPYACRQRTRCGAHDNKPQCVDADALIGDVVGTAGSTLNNI